MKNLIKTILYLTLLAIILISCKSIDINKSIEKKPRTITLHEKS